jgi:hypothetical protein
MRSRRPSAAGRPESPEAVTEHKTGYKRADTLQSKVLIWTRPAEVQRNCGAIRAEISSARTACIFRGDVDGGRPGENEQTDYPTIPG